MKESHKKFCLAIIAGKSRKEAAIAAGSAESSASNNAYKWMKRDDVKSFFDDRDKDLMNKATEIAVINQAYVLSELADNSKMSKLLDRPDYKASNQALGLIGKHIGMFIDRSEIVISSEVKEFLEGIVIILDEEIIDPEVLQRIMARMSEMPGLE